MCVLPVLCFKAELRIVQPQPPSSQSTGNHRQEYSYTAVLCLFIYLSKMFGKVRTSSLDWFVVVVVVVVVCLSTTKLCADVDSCLLNTCVEYICRGYYSPLHSTLRNTAVIETNFRQIDRQIDRQRQRQQQSYIYVYIGTTLIFL